MWSKTVGTSHSCTESDAGARGMMASAYSSADFEIDCNAPVMCRHPTRDRFLRYGDWVKILALGRGDIRQLIRIWRSTLDTSLLVEADFNYFAKLSFLVNLPRIFFN